MRGGFMLADPSPVDVVVDGPTIEIEGFEIEVISLAGHSPNQVGYLVDDVFFCADVVLPETVLAKYRIPYLFSVTDHLRALETAESVVCSVAVPGHGPTVADLPALIAHNRALVHDVADRIFSFAGNPMTAEALLTELLAHFGADVADAPSYYLLHPTIYAFLTHLERQGRLKHEIVSHQSRWVAT
jgi:glyoxylase-like metal-dependent hydrolase (beta-lactamase superfamily II)